jgi:hypothetical protein
MRKAVLMLVAVMVLAGCATPQPRTFEEAISSVGARQPLPATEAEELRYRVPFVYANRALTETPASWKTRSPDTLNSSTYDVLSLGASGANLAAGDFTAGTLDVVTWFGAGLSKESRWAYYLNATTPLVALANTHYFRFDGRAGPATAEDVYEAWDAAYQLMRALYPTQECRVFGWTPELEYLRTYMKDAPGSYKEILYLCDGGLVQGEKIKVNVSAFANPAAGLRTVSMVQRQCDLPRPRGEWIDITPCGIALADREAALIPEESDATWMQLVTTPSADDPGRMITIARYQGKELVMEPPPVTPEYAEFLRSRQRTAGVGMPSVSN